MADALEKQDHYTFADYMSWDENVRAEIIDGEVYMMAPPNRFHQGISGALFAEIYDYLKGKPCKVYASPFGVNLFPKDGEDSDTVVEPDISVICDPAKLADWGCDGAPEMVIEILSPSTRAHDRRRKFNKYREAGVQEYWIANGEEKTVDVFILKDGDYVSRIYGEDDIVPVTVLPGLEITLKEIFGE
jgi:Uma2 family endonuclease